MSAVALARELEAAGIRIKRTGNVTWRAKCPVCWTPDDPAHMALAITEWADGHEDILCWNPDCRSWTIDGPDTTRAVAVAVLWLAVARTIGVPALGRAFGIRRVNEAIETAGHIPLQPPRISVPH